VNEKVKSVFKEHIDAYKKSLIERVLYETKGSITRTSQALGIDRSLVHHYIKALGIDVHLCIGGLLTFPKLAPLLPPLRKTEIKRVTYAKFAKYAEYAAYAEQAESAARTVQRPGLNEFKKTVEEELPA
jgi:hypothetical protein